MIPMEMEKAYIIAAESLIDGNGSFDTTESIEFSLKENYIPVTHFHIDPLKAGWHSKLLENHFRSGCAPVEAVHEAARQIVNKTAQVVIISGEDNLRSSYYRETRQKLMAVYGDDLSIVDLYNRLAETFIQANRISKDDFKRIAGSFFENYKRTYQKTNNDCNPDAKWFEYITDLFRGVDCANPVIDFKGKLIVCNKKTAVECGIEEKALIEIAGTGIASTEDGPENIHKIAEYAHLVQAYESACEFAGVNIGAEFLNKNALLEIYTCYPVVPLAFLLKTGIASSYKQIPDLLKEYEITITGGMNLCKAPWNNPSLNALIKMYRVLQNGTCRYGAVHGNGGLGYRQGFVILKA